MKKIYIPGSLKNGSLFIAAGLLVGTVLAQQPITAAHVESKAAIAKRMSFAARWGSACGRAFDAKQYLQDHGQFDWLKGLLKEIPSDAWVEFTAGEKPLPK